MKDQLSGMANKLVEKFNKFLLELQGTRVTLFSFSEVLAQRNLSHLRETADSLAGEYAEYIRTYNQYLSSLKEHSPEIHNLKHHFDIVSSIKSQAYSMLNDKEQKANLYTSIYFNSAILLTALAAILISILK